MLNEEDDNETRLNFRVQRHSGDNQGDKIEQLRMESGGTDNQYSQGNAV